MGKEKIPSPIKRDICILRRLKEYLRVEKADVVHINVCNAIGLKYARIARKCGCKHVIVHSHNTLIEHDPFKIKLIVHYCFRMLYSDKNIIKIACSTEAGKFLFGKQPFHILKNGVNTERFLFDVTKREQGRKQYELKEDDFAICHVGRFAKQKNHRFLINLFASIVKKNPKSYLFLVGEGEEEKEIRDIVLQTGLENHVFFLGVLRAVENIYFMSDCMILPSLHEGLPVVSIEAQATGLSVFLADTISREASITSGCTFFSLDMPVDKIAEIVLACKQKGKAREDAISEVIESGYSIESETKKLFAMYQGMMKQ